MADAPLSIALFTYSTRPRGGVVHTLELAEALVALGQRVRVFALEKPGRSGFFRPTSVSASFIPVDERPDEEMADRVARYIDAYVGFLEREPGPGLGFDVYHAEDCISANALIRLRAAGRLPWVVRTVHHVDDFSSPSLVSCQHDSIVGPDTVLVVSDWWRRRLAEDYGIDARVVHNGVDVERFSPAPDDPAREAERAKVGLAGSVIVLAVGGVEPRKNSLVLLAAFARAAPELAAATGRRPVLAIVGGDTLFDYRDYRAAFDRELERLTADGQLEPGSVARLGPVEDDRLKSLYRAADVLAFPSVNEGWGLAVLEAQASGTPVVASDIEVLREYLVDGRNALIVAPDDPFALSRAIVRVVAEPALADALRVGGLATARQFDWSSAARRHLEIYRSLPGCAQAGETVAPPPPGGEMGRAIHRTSAPRLHSPAIPGRGRSSPLVGAPLPRSSVARSEERVIVAAFGGNAVTRATQRGTHDEQLANVRVMCEQIRPLIEAGHRLVIIHGNGPQIGVLALQVEAGIALGVPDQPFDVLGAMTQGQIGYVIQQTLGNVLREIPGSGGSRAVASLVTQVLVDRADPAFQHPTKPIGPFYDRELAERLAAAKGWTVSQDSDRGWRRVVPSPQPIEVIEAEAIRSLIAGGAIVIAGGGGGVPVVREPDGSLTGVEAVIDKDLAAERLAALVGADTLLLLTGVRRICLDYGTPRQRDLDVLSVGDASRYLAEGQFPEGSMGPKVKAAIQFLENGGREAIITAPEALAAALAGTDGTRIVPG